MIKNIVVIGPNRSLCNPQIFSFGRDLGEALSKFQATIMCGGREGFMEAVCQGVKESQHSFMGQTVGIMPESNSECANPYVDIAISTGVGIARNVILINSADIIIAVSGGAGTLSELAFAWQQKKMVLCVTRFDGWAKELAGNDLDQRTSGLFVPVSSIEEIIEQIKHFF